MAFLTEARAQAAAGVASLTAARQELSEFKNLSRTANFDVFLSHSYMDAQIIYGVKELLEEGGLRVYVDWIDDPQLGRDDVTPETADLLRVRMRRSNSLIFATSEESPKSKWMPWELGFFDGIKPDSIAILPIVETEGEPFSGQEYLGLYRHIEDVESLAGSPRLAIRTDTGTVSIKQFASV